MVGWPHHLNGHEFEQTPGDSEGQGSLACCSLWDLQESDMTQQLNNNDITIQVGDMYPHFMDDQNQAEELTKLSNIIKNKNLNLAVSYSLEPKK